MVLQSSRDENSPVSHEQTVRDWRRDFGRQFKFWPVLERAEQFSARCLGAGPCRDGSLGGDAAGEVQAGVPGGAYLATRASLALVLVLTARASEISFARAACPTVDPPLEARGTGKPARRDPPPRRVVRSPHDLPVASPGSRIRVSSAPPRRSLAVASSAVSDPVRPHPKTNDERSRALATTGSIRRQDERHLPVHVRQVRHVVPGDHRDRLPE